MTRWINRLALVALFAMLLCLAGCSDTTDNPDDTDPIDDDGDVSEDGDAPGDYPPGPYGYSLGDVKADFALRDASGKLVRLSDFYGEAKAILINHSAGWCTVCREETPTLQRWYQELNDQGVLIIQAIFEKNNTAPADQAFVETWKKQYKLTFPVLVDDQNIFLDYHPSIQQGGATYGTPLNIILDRDMTIRYLLEGDVPRNMYDRLVELTQD